MLRKALSVIEPCDADWVGMRPRQGGRHCGACGKTVHDLTSMTKREVERFIASVEGDAPCIRYRVDAAGTPMFAPSRTGSVTWGAAITTMATALAACSAPHESTEQRRDVAAVTENVAASEPVAPASAAPIRRLPPQHTPPPPIYRIEDLPIDNGPREPIETLTNTGHEVMGNMPRPGKTGRSATSGVATVEFIARHEGPHAAQMIILDGRPMGIPTKKLKLDAGLHTVVVLLQSGKRRVRHISFCGRQRVTVAL